MNIVPPVPVPTVFNAGTVNTESVRKDNVLREAIPQLAANEKSSAERGVGADSDKTKTPGQALQPLVYEKPVPQSNQPFNAQTSTNQDNGKDESAGKESAKEQQQQQAEQRQVAELKQRDAEVRAHEQAHAAVGGQYAGAPKYEYERGPDGRQYAVGGEVSIDVSKEATPEETVRKAQQVKAAALAPAEPSAQDLRVANEATQIALEARTEIASEKAERAQEAYNKASPTSENGLKDSEQQTIIGEAPDLDEIVDALDIRIPTRSLDNNQSQDDANELGDFDVAAANQFLANRDLKISKTVNVIEKFYQQVTNPPSQGLNLSA